MKQPPHAADRTGVFETFTPTLPKAHQDTPFVLLANIAPALQLHVLDQMRRPNSSWPTRWIYG